MRRATLALALAPVVAGPAVGAFAATSTGPSTSTPAPPADAQATAVGVDHLAAVGHTTSHAGGDGGKAEANAVEVGGKPLIDGKTGGSRSTSGSSSGALVDTGSTPLGSLALTPWQASAHQDPNGSSAASDAALAHATLIDSKTLDVWLFRSQSSSSWTDGQSSSTSTSDGADVNAGDGALQVVVLHSETSSGSKGSSTIASINGNDIGSSDQANGSCTINLPQILRLTCLDASGGSASNGQGASGADVATATFAGHRTPDGVISQAASTGASAPAANQPQTRVLGERSPNTSPAGTGNLPFTGFEAGLVASYGAALTGLGAAALRAGRRRRRRTAAAS